ncbi:MAG: MaoC family dehydratase [Bdellovibrionota bacterium]
MKFKVGDKASITVRVTDKMIRDFAELSGDRNPVHLDDEFAKTTRFGRRIAHGMITGALISRALATELPGPGAVYLSQTLKFTSPVFVDEEITIELTVLNVREEKGFLTIETKAVKADGKPTATGEALVMVQSSKG